MPKYISMTDLRFKLKDVIADVLASGKAVTVKRHGKKLVRLVPVRRTKKSK